MSYKKNRTEMAEQMLAKYGYLFCQNCGTSNAFKFEVHHIIFRSEKPNHREIHNKRNLIIVCSECHRRFHKHKKTRGKEEKQGSQKELCKKANYERIKQKANHRQGRERR